MDELDLILSNSQQGDEDWKLRRSGKFTASRFADLMTNGRGSDTVGQTALTYIQEVATERITGIPIEGFQGNTATDWGHENEPLAIEQYEQRTGYKVMPAPFVTLNGWVGGSPDGLIDTDGLLEVKCPYNSRYHLLRLQYQTPPKQYIWQIQGNLWVSGREWLDYVDFDPRFPSGSQLHVIRVHRDDKAIQQLSDRMDLCIEMAQELIDKVL